MLNFLKPSWSLQKKKSLLFALEKNVNNLKKKAHELLNIEYSYVFLDAYLEAIQKGNENSAIKLEVWKKDKSDNNASNYSKLITAITSSGSGVRGSGFKIVKNSLMK